MKRTARSAKSSKKRDPTIRANRLDWRKKTGWEGKVTKKGRAYKRKTKLKEYEKT